MTYACATRILARRYGLELTDEEADNALWEYTIFPIDMRWISIKAQLIEFFEEVQRGQAEGRPTGQAGEDAEGLPG